MPETNPVEHLYRNMHPLRKLRESGPHTTDQIESLLAEDVVFHSPVFVREIVGRALVAKVFAASALLRAGGYTGEFQLEPRVTMLRWQGEVGGRRIESLEIIEDDSNGLIVDRTLAFRPFPAVRLFREALHPLLCDVLPEMYWDYTDGAMPVRGTAAPAGGVREQGARRN